MNMSVYCGRCGDHGHASWDCADRFRALAADWHGGQASALYAFASTGTVVPGLTREVEQCIRDRDRTAHDTYPTDAQRDLDALAAFRAFAMAHEVDAD